jgi:hypothetical protein
MPYDRLCTDGLGARTDVGSRKMTQREPQSEFHRLKVYAHGFTRDVAGRFTGPKMRLMPRILVVGVNVSGQ